MQALSENVWNVLACPSCGHSLTKAIETGAVCSQCQTLYKFTSTGALDLRPTKPIARRVEFSVGAPLLPESGFDFEVLSQNPTPEVDYSGLNVPHHLSRELLSYFPLATNEQSLMLDLGCGNAIHRGVCEHAGFEYLGLDYNAPEATILGDAHALPFRDESFEFLLSVAVLEHLRFPFVMMQEANRVLQPGGTFIGTVAFLEPFHGDSYYHHTHLGTFNSLQIGGFSIQHVSPNDKWPVLFAQGKGLFPKMPRVLSRLLVMPLHFLHVLWWGVAGILSPKATTSIRKRNTTGAFAFIATKGPAVDRSNLTTKHA